MSSPRPRRLTTWTDLPEGSRTLHAWTDGSFRRSAGLGWVITEDVDGAGEVIAQGSESLGTWQTAFDAEITAIERALVRFMVRPIPSGIISFGAELLRSLASWGSASKPTTMNAKILVDIGQFLSAIRCGDILTLLAEGRSA